MADSTIKDVIDELEKEDLLKACNSLLRTDQRRKNIFKNCSNYVEPLPLSLGSNDSGKDAFAQNIPIKETLLALFDSETTSHVIFQNPFFQKERSPLGLILL